MNKLICEYCQGEFARAANLGKHQRTAKYCLILQQEKSERDSQLTCEYCNKVLSRSDSLHRHYLTCIEYLLFQRVQGYERELAGLRERLAEKDQQLEALSSRLWELTNISINKTNTAYTHIDQVTINEAPQPFEQVSPLRETDLSSKVTKMNKQLLLQN